MQSGFLMVLIGLISSVVCFASTLILQGNLALRLNGILQNSGVTAVRDEQDQTDTYSIQNVDCRSVVTTRQISCSFEDVAASKNKLVTGLPAEALYRELKNSGVQNSTFVDVRRVRVQAIACRYHQPVTVVSEEGSAHCEITE